MTTSDPVSADEIAVEAHMSPTTRARRELILAEPGFGLHFTDHMYVSQWSPEAGWHDALVKPYGPFAIDPASSVLHYAQEIFEGTKAYRHADGSIWTFRLDANAERFQRSAARLALPALTVDQFVGAVRALVKVDQDWVPSGAGQTLYIRPFMFASEVFLGVRAARHVTFAVIASPAGPYFSRGVKPVSLWLSEDFSRAAPGGTGAAKCGGNYAASLVAQQEAIANDCDQVVFLDAVEHTAVEELGGMNVFFVLADGTLVTPELNGSILEGVTRSSIIELADELGHKTDERRVTIDEWREGVDTGEIVEAFACGTAAVVTQIGALRWRGGEVSCPERPDSVALEIRQRLLDIQFGRTLDTHGWMDRIV